MDRFIESSLTTALSPIVCLKSNMDRFIAVLGSAGKILPYV